MTGLALAAVVGGVLALGAVHPDVALVVGGLMLVAASAALLLGARIGLPAGICLFAAAYTAVQAFPLPIGWVRVLSSATAEIWQRATSLLPGNHPTATLSIAPGASLLEALKWSVYAAALIAGRFVGRCRGPTFCVSVVFATGTLVALITIVHAVFDITRVYGIYAPLFAGHGWPTGPLLNSNNLAGYLNLATLCGFGLLLSQRQSVVPKSVLALALAVTIGCMLVSASRGGVAAFVIGVVLFAGIFALRERRRSRALGRVLVSVGIVLGGILLAMLAWSERMTIDLVSRDVPKLKLWTWSASLARDFPWFGVGRGGYEGAIASYRTIPGHISFAYAENLPLQFVCEWGVPVGIGLLIAFAVAFRPRRYLSSTASAGAYMGFIALASQNLVDLSLELMGIAGSVAFLLGGCREQHAREEAHAPANRTRAAGFALFGLTLLGLAASSASSPALERQRLHDEFSQALASNAGAGEALELARAAVLREPGSAYPFQLGSVAALRLGTDPLPWVSRALERDPLNPRVHLDAARALLARRATTQAFLHLRLATEYEPSLIPVVAELAARFSRKLAELEQVAPAGAASVPMLLKLADAVDSDDLREQLLRRAAERNPNDAEATRRRALDLMSWLESSNPRCASERKRQCEEDVARLAGVLQMRVPKGSDWVRLRARLAILSENFRAADEVLAKHCGEVEPRLDCVELRILTSLRGASADAHQGVVAEAREVCGVPDRCARIELLISEAYLGMGWQREALGPRRRVAELVPSVGNWMRVGELAAALGNRVEADRALRRALEFGPDPATSVRIEELRAKLAGGGSGG